MTLQEIIKSKGEEKIKAKESKNDKFKRKSKEVEEYIVKNYGRRIKKMCDVMKMIRDYDPELWETIRPERFRGAWGKNTKSTDYFFTNGIEHCLGFYDSLEAIGQEAGGANGDVDFKVTEYSCTFEMRGPDDDSHINFWSRTCAMDFGKKYVAFENRFRAFVNEHYGDWAYDIETI